MASPSKTTHGVMEGGGSYNRNARIPAGGGSFALPFLEEAARNIAFASSDQPVVIADYGSSQGKNSLVPMRTAIKTLRARLGQHRPIFVVHIDQAANDFNSLFDVLHRDPERYSADDPNVFPSAIGRSFYENVLPKEHVHLGWSSYAAVWLSRIPCLIPGHFMPFAATGDVREAFDRQAAEDWKFFLSLRSAELCPGGRLVVVLPGLGEDGPSGLESVFSHANAVLAEMVSLGALTAEERARMVLGSYPRRKSQLLAPFVPESHFAGLTVERCEVFQLSDPAWEEYERDKNTEALANRHAGFFGAVFVPSLATALADPTRTSSFSDDLARLLTQRLSQHPSPMHSFVQVIVLAKHGRDAS